MLFIGSQPGVANIFQPQLNGIISIILGDSRFYLLLITVPIVALLPDYTLVQYEAIFYPPVEINLLKLQQERGDAPPPPLFSQ